MRNKFFAIASCIFLLMSLNLAIFLEYRLSFAILIIFMSIYIITIYYIPEIMLTIYFSKLLSVIPYMASAKVQAIMFFVGSVIVLVKNISNKTNVQIIRSIRMFDYAIAGFPLIVFFIMLFGLLYSKSPNYGFNKTMLFFFYAVLPSIIILVHFRCNPERLKKFMLLIVFCGLLLSIECVNKFILIDGIIGEARINPYSINPIWAARIITLSIFSAFYYWNKWDFKQTLIKSIVFAILLIGLMLTNSKGPIISMIVSLIAIMVLKMFNVNSLKAFISNFAGVSLVTVLVVLAISVLPVYMPRFDVDDTVEDARSFSIREELIESAFNGWVNGNQIIGEGTGSFSYLLGQKDERRYPHNILLEILYENGAILVLFCLIIWIYALTKSSVSIVKYNTNEMKYSFSILSLGITNAMFSGDLNGNLWIWYGVSMTMAFSEFKKLENTSIK